MPINIAIVRGKKIYVSHLGRISEKDSKIISDVGKEKKFKCLRFIDPYTITIFNTKQVTRLLNELKMLKLKLRLTQETIGLIQLGAKQVLSEPGLYLAFIGD